MRLLFVIFIFMSVALQGQDKVIFKDGALKKGIVISVSKEFIFFKLSDTSRTTEKIKNSELLMVEKYDGKVYVFGSEQIPTDTTKKTIVDLKRHSLTTQPFSFLLGRVGLAYEHLSKDGKIGFVLPFAVTFDPLGTIYKESADSSNFERKHHNGINFVVGADVNFYIGKKETSKFYIGPRVRYGVDMFVDYIEGYSLQTQFGWKKESQNSRFVQHIAFGFGFVRILSIPYTNRINPKQSFGWGSITYKVGIKW